MILDIPVQLADQTLTSTYLVGTSILVHTSQIESGPPVYEITAIAGQSTEVQRHTFGNDAGTGPAATTLQTWLNNARQATADGAAWDESLRTATVV